MANILKLAVASLGVVMVGACGDYNSEPDDQGPPLPKITAFTAVGDSTVIAAKLDQFRASLGGVLNLPTVGPSATGRREINWDGVPAALTNVDNFPASFFNVNSKRGVVFTTPGTGLRVDSTDFAALNAGLASQFKFFSTKKTFTPVGSNVMEANFQIAGQAVPGVVNGFGVIFSDVDRVGSTVVEFFDVDGVRLARLEAPARAAAHEFSFVGGSFATSVVARVRITSGEAALTATITDLSSGGVRDLVVMDDFIFGEPQPIQ